MNLVLSCSSRSDRRCHILGKFSAGETTAEGDRSGGSRGRGRHGFLGWLCNVGSRSHQHGGFADAAPALTLARAHVVGSGAIQFALVLQPPLLEAGVEDGDALDRVGSVGGVSRG